MLDRKRLFEILSPAIKKACRDDVRLDEMDYKDLVAQLILAEYGSGDQEWFLGLYNESSTESEQMDEFVGHLRMISC